MKIYKIGNRTLIDLENEWFELKVEDWDHFLNRDNLMDQIIKQLKGLHPLKEDPVSSIHQFDPPMGSQEVWAAGVTYMRSKVEREKESEKSGGSLFYDKVYDAERPELFFKATPQRTVGSGEKINIRRDSSWNVPEPELTLFISSKAIIQGYTVGNDMSSRSIEGENPLYLPQAKTYEKCAALGPCLYIPEAPIDKNTEISLLINRDNSPVFKGKTRLNQMKRSFEEIVGFLFRESRFPNGCFLMTGTGIVPSEDFSLQVGDEIRIAIEGIGELVNYVATQ